MDPHCCSCRPTYTWGNTSDAPILLWTQGGPGQSSLFGQFLQNGPIAFDANPNISVRTNTLQKNMSVIYLDVPVGAGFSFADSLDGYSTSLEDITRDVMEFLRQFLELFSELKNRDFYLAGESYAARYSVAIAHQLLTDTKNLPLQLKGIIGGNGFLGPILDTVNSSEFRYQTSMLDDNGRMQFDMRFQYMKNLSMTENATQVPAILFSTIFADPTQQRPSCFQNLTLYNDHASPLYTERPYYMLACFFFLNSSLELRRQIHVGDNAIFRFSELTLLTKLAPDVLRDISNLTQRVLNETRVLFYTGQLDALFPSVNQRAYFSTLQWAHTDQYRQAPRKPWSPAGRSPYMGFAGYMKQAANFTDVVLLGMSHYGAAEKPDEAYYLTTEFVANQLGAI
ncbi:probable serine carboxypeptidase CPVL isoform X2 [Dermacentor albipictus]|uniref:probable serine carboxypeptidase CPVL isoform X2 n=1 Tax=Dermacentor albipictus TaxID=60249 RepID=UPI0038FCF9D7